jgi:hypothetical protein
LAEGVSTEQGLPLSGSNGERPHLSCTFGFSTRAVDTLVSPGAGSSVGSGSAVTTSSSRRICGLMFASLSISICRIFSFDAAFCLLMKKMTTRMSKKTIPPNRLATILITKLLFFFAMTFQKILKKKVSRFFKTE